MPLFEQIAQNESSQGAGTVPEQNFKDARSLGGRVSGSQYEKGLDG